MLDFQVVAAPHQGGGQLPGKADVLQSRLIFPYRRPVIGDAALLKGILSRQTAQQSGFARAVASHQAVDLSGLEGEGQVFQHCFPAVGLAQAVRLQNTLFHNGSPSSMADATMAISVSRSSPSDRPSRTMGRI